jgi:hypothetical protein
VDVLKEFADPGAQDRAKPFWAWNGKLKKEELLRQIDNMKEMGFGGFFMHSRTGLATEYLGEEWFSLINDCADYAKKLGMEAWLYDEDRWPSGTAGGMVTKHPEYRMRHIVMERVPKNSIDFSDPDLLGAFEAREQDGLLLDYRRVGTVSDTEGDTLLRFRVEEMEKGSFYNGYTYVDTLNREATDYFLKLTHEAYVSRCGDRIGDGIRGIFTDEPHRGQMMSSFGQGNGCGEYQVPFTPALPQKFQEKYGYDLLQKLPELFCRRTERGISPIKWQFVELVQELFLENFAKPIDRWCREHHLILSGHILHENNLTAQTAMSGSMMRYYEFMEYPGIDYLGEHEPCYWIAKQLQSVARQTGKEYLLSELYGCTGWQMSFEKYKKIGDWQALYGINLRCPHLSWYTMEGQAKRDFPASIFHQSPWWREYRSLEDYYGRIAVFQKQGKADCGVLVLNPVESVWAQIFPGWCDGLAPKAQRIQELEEQYQNTFWSLQKNHIDFDYGDEGILAQRGTVSNGSLLVGLCQYHTVIVSGMDTIRSSTVSLLEELLAQGGRVIFWGEEPEFVDCLPSQVFASPAFSRGEKTDGSVDALLGLLTREQTSITKENGQTAQNLLCQVKQDQQRSYYMVINSSEEQTEERVRLRFPGKRGKTVTRFYPKDGKVLKLSPKTEGDDLILTLDFPPLGECLLAVGDPYPEVTEEKKTAVFQTGERPAVKLTAAEPMEYRLDEPNLCVLDFAKASVNGSPYSEEMEILKADRFIRDVFGLPYRGGEMLQPWFVGQKEVPVKGKVSLAFSFAVEELPQKDLTLVLEESERFSVSVNGVPLQEQKEGFYWVDACFDGIVLPPSLLRSGQNTIELMTDYRETSNLEAVYLLGGFGVSLSGNRKILTGMPERLLPGDITGQGFPFYSGKITYLCPLSIPEGKRAVLEIEDYNGACVKIQGNGKEEILSWKPYRMDITDFVEHQLLKITVVLTRRNTFGPLHQLPALAYSYGPDNFETTGREFTENYSLLPAGLGRFSIAVV